VTMHKVIDQSQSVARANARAKWIDDIQDMATKLADKLAAPPGLAASGGPAAAAGLTPRSAEIRPPYSAPSRPRAAPRRGQSARDAAVCIPPAAMERRGEPIARKDLFPWPSGWTSPPSP
jgi:hypothetical protein